MARFRLRTFGGLSLESIDAGPVPHTGRRPLALLALLAAAGPRGLSRDKVTALLWPERDTEHGRNSLSQVLSTLRRDLGADDTTLGASEIRLNPDVVTSDVEEFESSLAHGNAERAETLYEGPFLDGFFLTDAPEFERWVEQRRSVLHQKQRDALESLARDATRRDDGAAAVAWWRRFAAHEPTSARAATGLMESLAASGEVAAALLQFREYAAAVQRELGVEPEATVAALAERLRGGDRAALPSAPSTSGVTHADSVPVVASTQSSVVVAAAAPARPTRHFVRIAGIIAGALVLVAGTYAMVSRPRMTPRGVPTVALIPRMPAGADTTERYFSQGVTDELFVALARLPQIRLLGRESAREFSNDSTDLRDAARRLGVAYVLELRPRVRGSTVHINADLVRGAEGTVAWSATFDGELKDLGSLQRDIAEQIFDVLEIKLGADQLRGRRHKPNADAYDQFFRGRFHLARGSEQDIRRSLEYFAAAIERDSLFAAPYSAAATAWNQLADAFVPPLDAYPKSDSLARRALELDETNAEAHANVGYAAAVLRWDWETARREFLRAIELNPSDAWAHNGYAFYLQARNDLPKAIDELRKATELEPFVGYYGNTLGLMLTFAGQLDAADAEYRRVEEVVPGYRYGGTGATYVLFQRRRCAEAVPSEEAADERAGRPTDFFIMCLLQLGRRADAERGFQRMEAAFKKKYFFPEAVGAAAFALGYRERALDWLELGVNLHSATAPVFWLDPYMRPLLSEPRYRNLLARMHLDDVAKP